jgi:SAM-dependent methyltransferase
MVPLDWIDVSDLSFSSLLLLERIQLSWFPGWVPEREFGIALRANPAVEWALRRRCPEIAGWLDNLMGDADQTDGSISVREAEEAVMREINDLLVYVVDPTLYDARPFLGWDSSELTDLVDFSRKTVVDVGSGTGRLALVAARSAAVVYAVEPVGNLRRFLREKATRQGLANVYPADGLVTDIPFPDGFADVTMGGHVFGDDPENEVREVLRVTRPGGTVIACPGNDNVDNAMHRVFVAHGFDWSRFEEPEDGTKRKYWRTV